jgi:hypothetical protein
MVQPEAIDFFSFHFPDLEPKSVPGMIRYGYNMIRAQPYSDIFEYSKEGFYRLQTATGTCRTFNLTMRG